jgi:hypothetical protein
MFYYNIPEKMTNYIDSRSLGLQPRTIVEVINENTMALVIKRKSRLIMADGKKILVKVEKIKKAKSGYNVMLKTTAPVCSKTLQYLSDHGVELITD